MKSLAELFKGEYAYIVDLKDNEVCEDFFDMGCFPGDLIRVLENNPNKDSMKVSCKNFQFPIYKKAAKKVITNVVSFEISLN